MLDEIKSRGFALGSNLKGGPSDDPSWLFLLPELDLNSVRLIGRPLPAVMATLKQVNPAATIQPLQSTSEETDLLIVTPRRRIRSLPSRRPTLVDRLSELAPETTVILFGDTDGASPLASLKRMSTLAKGPPPPAANDALIAGREGLILPDGPRRAGPVGDLAVLAKRTSKRIDHIAGGRLRRLRSRLNPTKGGSPDISLLHPAVGGGAGRAAIILPEGIDASAPPRYLVRLAADHGYDISGHRWALAPPRGYRSQKVLFFVYRSGSDEADLVIKLTQDAVFNERLANEASTLRRLTEMGVPPAGTTPLVVFAGQVAGLTAVGETALTGEPFRARSSGRPDCEFAKGAIDFLVELGRKTAEPATAPDWSDTLSFLADQFVAFYRPAPPAAQQLRSLAAAIGDSERPPPTVLQHGDPGNWNLIVTPQGKVGFLDWESAELTGIPLWDLFVFVKTYAAWGARLGGANYSADVFEEQLLRDSPYRRLLIDQAERYCVEVGVPSSAIDSLFVFCWVYQSLKEVGRLKRTDLRNGSNARLVAKCLAAEQATGRVIGNTLA